ncbi:tRNA (adenosine(37)-N6)-threonylcarbamoyltransferase complex ATPase subunit type 1 TsaE [Acidihalobacter yilgarnensis]|uniref:tRNA threonylcarbamoyladenosine biosynthesis protein TsaE n=1 Tax=Acidihalobacter yilgarnensis TaxID=2819280 RepID=A0A1D8ISZ8_9GAMM|nr:tRNA (adenosine(37)-N6)-threonylcarbamoyltransferase complex ATPase subunit type 1 TsaE [Acidihalobacter yilgarnensis]AOU99543.1 tRNA (adenosine(37)-N6)-threonylcarbamoyltransferase complex ATPase subunit type 1 TsaE [Acidihalobacter yilgarnensis]
MNLNRGVDDGLELALADEAATEHLGAALARALPRNALVFLHGNLGAGKTTLARALLRALGHAGAVRSPTYTLVEPYEIDGRRVFHFDLYRLADPEELEAIGLRDYLDGDSLCLIEWPERGAGMLPAADLDIHLATDGAGRHARLLAEGEKGRSVLISIDVM